jgi:PleD family two-component response regulator
MGKMSNDTAMAIANPIRKVFRSLEMNTRPSEIVMNVPIRVMVTVEKMENDTIGSCSSIGRQARIAFAGLESAE